MPAYYVRGVVSFASVVVSKCSIKCITSCVRMPPLLVVPLASRLGRLPTPRSAGLASVEWRLMASRNKPFIPVFNSGTLIIILTAGGVDGGDWPCGWVVAFLGGLLKGDPLDLMLGDILTLAFTQAGSNGISALPCQLWDVAPFRWATCSLALVSSVCTAFALGGLINLSGKTTVEGTPSSDFNACGGSLHTVLFSSRKLKSGSSSCGQGFSSEGECRFGMELELTFVLRGVSVAEVNCCSSSNINSSSSFGGGLDVKAAGWEGSVAAGDSKSSDCGAVMGSAASEFRSSSEETSSLCGHKQLLDSHFNSCSSRLM